MGLATHGIRSAGASASVSGRCDRTFSGVFEANWSFMIMPDDLFFRSGGWVCCCRAVGIDNESDQVS